MNRKFGWILAASLCPGPVFALGLGKLVLDSGLNEPLEARIELLSPTREELDSLNVALAGSEAFERAGVVRDFILSSLKFELRESDEGPDVIRVYSREAIREPYLNFLVEINWSKGRLVREYTVLLDPPLYDPGMRAPMATAATPVRAPEPEATEAGGMTPETAAPAAAASYTGGDYGPTQQNDTLWSIASRMRPNDSVSVQQMMLALYRTNPEAFINNNINGLRRGQILRVPPESELAAMTREQAFAEAQAQNGAWDSTLMAEAAAPAPQVAPAAPEQPAAPGAAEAPPASAPSPTPPPGKEAELRLVAPGKSGKGAGGEAGAADQNLNLANEQLAALTQENIDLKDRVKEAETIIEDLKRLITLKDEELAALQKNLAAAPKPGPAAATEPATPAPETKAEAAKPSESTPAGTATPPPEEPAAKAVETKSAAPAKAAAAAPAAKPKPAAASESKPPETAMGVIVEQAVTWLKGNLMIIGGALGAIVVVIAGLMVVSRRKHASAVAAEDEAAAAVQFPDFAGSEEETILPGAAAAEEAAPEVGKRGAPAARAEVKPAPAAAKPQAAAPAPAPAPEAPQEDPLAEVNVFLAYEHFDQAEQFVREAINREPDNLDFHSKLLEVFYAANDRRKYEQAARVLHDKVGGKGPHWDMALVMWNEISPNRAIFSEPAADEEQAPAPAAGVGMLDLTSKEKTAAADDGSLDFDLGEMTAEPAAQAAAAASDVLDVTASVGLGTDEELLSAATGEQEEDVLDLTGGQGADEALPDPAAAQTGDDLLDVTAHSNLEDAGLDADPLDVTVSAPSGITDDMPAAPKADADAGKNAMDFDLSLDPGTPAADDNMIEFESGSDKQDAEAGGLELDLSAGMDTPAEEDVGLDLDIGSGTDDDLGLSLEMPGADEAGAGELSLEGPGAEAGELDLSFDDADTGGAGELSLDMGDEGSDQTVFVPRTDGTQAQSAEDEIATKLDLAKAYVELGDKSSARGILDEIASEGNEEQRRQAEELRKQAS
jgi:pilus assembly protein FimV